MDEGKKDLGETLSGAVNINISSIETWPAVARLAENREELSQAILDVACRHGGAGGRNIITTSTRKRMKSSCKVTVIVVCTYCTSTYELKWVDTSTRTNNN